MNEITLPATCTTDGVRTYTATAVFEGETYTDTKTEIIPVKGDANGDEVVTVEDATLLQMCLAEFGITQETQS